MSVFAVGVQCDWCSKCGCKSTGALGPQCVCGGAFSHVINTYYLSGVCGENHSVSEFREGVCSRKNSVPTKAFCAPASHMRLTLAQQAFAFSPKSLRRNCKCLRSTRGLQSNRREFVIRNGPDQQLRVRVVRNNFVALAMTMWVCNHYQLLKEHMLSHMLVLGMQRHSPGNFTSPEPVQCVVILLTQTLLSGPSNHNTHT